MDKFLSRYCKNIKKKRYICKLKNSFALRRAFSQWETAADGVIFVLRK